MTGESDFVCCDGYEYNIYRGWQLWESASMAIPKRGGRVSEEAGVQTANRPGETSDTGAGDWDIFIATLVERHGRGRNNLIPLLQDIQEEHGYLPREALSALAHGTGVSVHEIYGVATFYKQFRFNKPGKHQIRVCEGTACHVRGGARILDAVERCIGIGPDETTEDGLFSLELVACMGCCALAPVMVVDDDVYGSCTTTKVADILQGYREVD